MRRAATVPYLVSLAFFSQRITVGQACASKRKDYLITGSARSGMAGVG